MAYSTDELTEQLIQLKCRSNFKIKNIAEYMLANSKEAIYTHSEAGKGKIIIRPAFEVFSDDFATIDEVTRVQGYFHSSEMTRFPTRIHKSAQPIHYGVAFKINSAQAAKDFIAKLTQIING
ncbi:hypothetical protein CWC16_09475 [Pseudoalteromonas sp. S3776]|uniref:hypothetical protein n=1 Tax=unclassified Pseudoalteromonas TaxID=194690 RepID=UPI001108B574|nr:MULTISPECIES: hypothetical protein [unclassified Pseudoalteromonas]TMO77311.1 hypothetical protein CWC17_02020 [Pseudoalteromonas sp. S3785]TMO80019.1 hypothetical protein CWC16_09475 [Pseudoalteromonas sp. S3776]